MESEIIKSQELHEALALERDAQRDKVKGLLTGLIAVAAVILVASNQTILSPEVGEMEQAYRALSLAGLCLTVLPAAMTLRYFMSSSRKMAEANQIRFNAQSDEYDQTSLLN